MLQSDAQLSRLAARTVSRPRARPADSFVLHAPLELAARVGLLAWVAPSGRDAARARIARLAAGFEAAGPPVDDPAAVSFASPGDAARHLAEVVAAGDLVAVDAAAAWLGRHTAAHQLPALVTDLVLPSLAAAGHAPIFLYLLPRVAPRGELTGELLRPLARELARHPDWRLRWFDEQSDGGRTERQGPASLDDALAAVPFLGVPGSTFIFPTMHQVEASGVAARCLGRAVWDASTDAATDVLLRAAARSMLLEPWEHAPYGWSHCLTMPQAVLGVAGHATSAVAARAVAATFVAGFRASLATVTLDTPWTPRRPPGDLEAMLRHDPEQAAASVWHADDDQLEQIRVVLATWASSRHDAHLVKYTLACLDAADRDRSHQRLFLAAGAKLLAYWVLHPDPDDALPQSTVSGLAPVDAVGAGHV